MKKFLMLLVGLGLLTSCSYRVYPISTLQKNYDLSMLTSEEISAKNKVAIYLNEEDIPGDYEVLSYVTYHPFFSIPIFYSEYSQQKKKFYKKAVLKANELGGNAILVTAVSEFKVLSVSGGQRVSADESMPEGSKLSGVLLDQFEKGEVYKMESKVQSKYADMLKDEIEDDIKRCKTLDECALVHRKIDALAKYYETLDKKSRSAVKTINEFNEDLGKVEQKLERRSNRKARVENMIGNIKERATKTN